MKMNIIKHIATAAIPAALLLTSLTAAAQNYPEGSYRVVGGIGFNKHVTDNHDGSFTVDLESFVTGKVHTETVKSAADIILAMDLSASMNAEIGGYDRTYTEENPLEMVKVEKLMTRSASQNWSYNSLDAATERIYSYLYNGMYYPVYTENITTGDQSGRGRHLFIWIPNPAGGTDYVKRYIYGQEGVDDVILHDIPNTTPTTAGGTIYTGTLYSGGWHYNDFDATPSASERNYFYKSGDKYYPVLRQSSGNLLYVYLPEGKKYFISTDDKISDDSYGHYEGYSTAYYGELYHGGGWTSTSITDGTNTAGHYYKHTDGNYYKVDSGPRATIDGVSTYQATVVIRGTTYYLYDDGISTSPYPAPFADPDCTIYFGKLYRVASAQSYPKKEGLRRAVTAFIDALATKSEEDGLDHRLALVMFNAATGNVNYPDLKPAPLSTNGSSHVVKDFLVVKDNVDVLKAEFPSPMPTASGGSIYSRGFSLSRGLLTKELGADAGTDINNNGSIDAYEVPTRTETSEVYDKKPKIIICLGDFQLGDDPATEVNKLKNTYTGNYPNKMTFNNTSIATVVVNSSSAYDATARQYASSPNLFVRAEYYDETLIDALMQMTDEIGGAELEVEGTVVTVDVVSQAFNIPTGDDVSAPKVYIAQLTGKKAGTSWDPASTVSGGDEEFVYYTFGREELQGESSGITLTEGVDDQGNKKLSVEGFDYSAHWCGPDNNNPSGDYHTEGQKLILRFTVVPNENAVGGPAVQTNTEESGIYADGERIATFNQPSVSLPVNLWIEKQGLEGDDSAVFTIYYADPNAPENEGKDPHEMTYQSFTKVIVHASDLVDGKAMVKITGLDSKFYYKIKEDAWAWSYDYQTGEMYSSDVIQNPIQFVNETKETVKHAESFVTNEFSSNE